MKAQQAYDGKNYEAAAAILLKLAEGGYAPAQCWLGSLYAVGQGVPQDVISSISWQKKSIEQAPSRKGSTDCLNNMANRYSLGDGVEADYAQAHRLYKTAVENGNSFVYGNWGLMYEEGKGVSVDYKEAYRLYQKAADLGMSDGYQKLAGLYANGLGVPQDCQEAIRLTHEAIKHADKRHVNADIFLRQYPECPGLKPDKWGAEILSEIASGGLMWMPVTFSKNWQEANSYCTNTTISRRTDWRMPTQAELSALYATGTIKRHGWTLGQTWSSTVNNSSSHYGVNLSDGYVFSVIDAGDNYVACVHASW